MFRKYVLMLGLAALAAAPAQASVTIAFTGGNSATSGTPGNIVAYSNGGVSVQASAWSFSGLMLGTAWLGQYSDGLGVTNTAEGTGSIGNSSAIDNVGGYDFLLLVFDQAVNLQSAVLTPYQVGTGTADNDATVSYANLAGAFQAPTPTPIGFASPVWSSLVTSAYSVSGNNNSPFTTGLNPGGNYGNVWLVSADILGLDQSPDGFRLTSVTVNTPVPEPSAWAMALLGFLGIGSMLRRCRKAPARLPQLA